MGLLLKQAAPCTETKKHPFMKINIVMLLTMTLPALSFSQKYDYQWPIGYSSDPPMGIFGISLLDFDQQFISLDTYNLDFHPIHLSNSSSFVCDENGQLLLLTNNCKVFDRDFNVVPGTDTLTPGEIFDLNCEQYGEYPSSQSVLILPEMSNDSVFYIAHKDAVLSDELQAVVSEHFYLSTLVKKAAGGFYLKETQLLADLEMVPGKLTACLNADGDRWWAWVADFHSNTFYKFLIGGEETVQGPFVQEIGDPIRDKDEGGIGQSAFSPNADKMGILTEDHTILLYDFDNGSGELSNYRVIPVAGDDTGYGRGLAFSFDSELVYMSTVQNLYQVDPSDSTWQHIAFHNSLDEDGYPVGIGKLVLGPDCRMYVSPGSPTYYMHVVHHPNQKGVSCGFEPRALRSPTVIPHHFPNLPMYRFGGACDSTIQFPVVSSTEVAVEEKTDVKVFPNPFGEELTVTFGNAVPKDAVLRVYGSMGRLHFESPLPAFTSMFTMGDIPSGVYFYEIREGQVLLKNGKLVKVE